MKKWEGEWGDFCTLKVFTELFNCIHVPVPAINSLTVYSSLMFTRTLTSTVRFGEPVNFGVIADVWEFAASLT